ncbi:hypothetical protein N9993_01365 [bacterium]|jgi:hypothetical protein|nr:hypothetical protein [bacterium]
MKSATNIGVMDTVDWQEFCSSLLDQVPATIAPHTGLGYINGELETVTKPEDLEATLSTWDSAGYKKVSEGGSAEWYMFYPGLNFDESVQERLMDFMGVQDANACWVSMIKPGFCCPWHIDQHELRSFGLGRYHVHINPPEMGHVFMIEDDYYINQPVGTVYKWRDPFIWHAGFNGGRTPKLLLNFV